MSGRHLAEDLLSENEQLKKRVAELERIEAERDAAEAQIRFQAGLLDAVGQGVVATDIERRVVFWNRCAEAMYGWSRDEALGQDVTVLLGAEVEPPPVSVVGAALARGGSIEVSAPARRKDGAVFPVDLTITAVKDAAGNMLGSVGVLSDATGRRRAEKALEDSVWQYRQLFEQMIAGFAVHEIICDEEGRPHDYRFLSVNPAFERLTGRRASEIVGKTVREAFPGTEQAWIDAYGHVALTGEPLQFEEYHAPLDRYFEGRAFCTEPGKFAVIFVDITEKRRLQEALQQAVKMEAVGRLAGGVAHDFNNLLTPILAYSEIMTNLLPAEGRIHSYAVQIHRMGRRAADLTRQLLAFSRKQVLESAVLDLNRTIADLQSMLCRLLGEDVSLDVALDADAGLVRADPGQMEQVIVNLAVNARDAMPTGGAIRIATAGVHLTQELPTAHGCVPAGRYVRVTVSDTGCGMDRPTLARVFEPFFTTKGRGQGTGLGLATVDGIVAQSGGSISVESESGRGTAFSVFLPRVDAAEAPVDAPAAVPAPAPTGDGERILLVEDDTDVRVVAAAVLEMHGYQVLAAADGEEALAICAADPRPVDLLVTDVVMPGISGSVLADRITALHPQTRVLFMSGYTNDATMHHGVQQGTKVFLQKPFALSVLANKVREILDR